jgi:signal transduction histidine kinase
MSGNFALDWAILSVSLFNTIVLLWLGLTVLLNAERRHMGIWLAGGGLLTGAAFFLIHTLILGFGLYLSPVVDFWWRLGWIPVILSPLAWYVVMLWYAGFWEGRQNAVYLRQRYWLWLLLLATAVMLGMFLVTNPLPSFSQALRFDLSASPSWMGVPLLILFYPIFILACIGLALDALLRPGPTVRMMGNLARLRARPWLVGASFVFFLVGLLVGAILWWFAITARQHIYSLGLVQVVAWADLLIATLIAAAVTLTGQAIVSYEVFTGKTLPRRGLLHYWHRALILALGYSAAVSLSVTIGLPPTYSLLLSTGLMVLFYALLSWRAYAERERFISDLRPFIASQRLYDQLLSPNGRAERPVAQDDPSQPFRALCEKVLGARFAYLAPLGSLAPLFGPPLVYPPDASVDIGSLLEITTKVSTQFDPHTLCIPLEGNNSRNAAWAVPLWNARGLCGALLLGEKWDKGVYTQEEIEIARSICERLVDTQASAEIARRLLELQRRQLIESQVLDRRARRALHDDILPLLHAALLTLAGHARDGPMGERDRGQEEVTTLLVNAHRQVSNLLRDLPPAAPPEVARLGLVGALQRVAQEELNGAFDEVTWQIDPAAQEHAGLLPPLTAEVLFYAAREAMRNAARHARPAGSQVPLHLHVKISWKDGLEILVADDGVGLESAAASGGSGQGLALHSTLLALLGGSLSIESPPPENIPDASTCVRMSLPLAPPR